MAIDKGVWRPVYIDDWDWLEDCSPLAQRLWFWLSASKQSTATGLQRVRQHAAVGVLRTKPTAYTAALAELEDAGRVAIQSRGDGWVDLYLTLWVRRQCAVRDTQRAALRRLIDRFADGAAKLQAIEDWTVWDSACRQADGSLSPGRRQPEPQQEQEQEQEQKTILSTPLPTVTAPTGATAPSKERKEKAVQPDPAADLIALYHEACPSLARSQGKPVTLKACAVAVRRESDLAAWKERFRRAELSDFLTGRSGNDRPFKADLLWILNPTNAEKIDAGRYDNRGKPGMATHVEAYKAPEPEKIWPFYAKSGKGLDAPEYMHPEWGPTDMTEAGWKAFDDALPFGKPR